MKFIEPKPRLEQKSTWHVSEQTKATVKYYAEYTGYSEDEVVDQFLLQLRDDPKFLEWLQSKRRNKRAFSQMFADAKTEGEQIGET
ncbi:hypothetical protein DFP93_11643 [Aneurinibacillus soli]|uniref:Uncharacterized protein n=1 Tax=Aneurinibacillus soli TaxID=1500254 RepID=A0A0U4WLP8_9BACL|nr:hypothetical protein [Aneurinibacillus soli]PYE59676.1 hypothetical protein DFP93_11643 [Aneurinibacillus soli]BAU29323.1 hypothetical protein CB4_03510 [Aneurinibacillus soli]